MGFVGRKPTNAPLTSSDLGTGIVGSINIADGTITSSDLAPGAGGIAWQSVQTTGFTAVAGRGYPCNTTSAAFTVTLPASPSVGDQIAIVDYAGTFATNKITISSNGNKIEGVVVNKLLTTNREAVTITYIDSTQGWVSSSGANEGTQSIDPIPPYTVDFLVIAGGGAGSAGGFATGSGGGGAGGYRNSYSTETSGGGGSSESSLSFNVGTVYTITVGAGGSNTNGSETNGNNSSISGTGLTTITSTGGGLGGGFNSKTPGAGGSGGGGAFGVETGGSGTANQGYAGGTGLIRTGGGGGGSGGTGGDSSAGNGGNGGSGTASSITGSSVTRAGGGGGGSIDYTQATSPGSGGSGGGGTGGDSDSTGNNVTAATNGTVNTGSGGGGPTGNSTAVGGSGGKGVVILRMPTINYTGTTTGSPTVTTDGSDKVLVFNDSGSYTA